jgi:hypothetical protein
MKGNRLPKRVKENRIAEKSAKLGLYLTPHALMGYHNIIHFLILGSRGRGKSVISLDAPLSYKFKYGFENVKIYYMRISDLSIKAMLEDNGKGAIDPILINKYHLNIKVKGRSIYHDNKELIEFYPLVSAGKVGKGVSIYDANYLNKRPINPKTGKPIKRFIFIILDEFLMAEGIEKRSIGEPVEQFKIYLEGFLRDQEILDYDAVRIFYLANAVSECATFMGTLFNFIPRPGDFGIKKLTRKHCIVWNVPNSEAYIAKRKKSYTSDVFDYENDPNYTNIVKRDLDLIKPKHVRIRKVTMIIMFSKYPQDWFCLYDGKYIREYHKEQVNKNKYVAMIRHLDVVFIQDLVRDIYECYDARGYRYCDIISQARFGAKMKLLKSK